MRYLTTGPIYPYTWGSPPLFTLKNNSPSHPNLGTQDSHNASARTWHSRVYKVRSQISGPYDAPYAQKLDLEWAIVGNVCLGKTHKTPTISTLHIFITEGRRHTLFEPCPNTFQGKEVHHKGDWSNKSSYYKQGYLGRNVFQRNVDDEKVAPSDEDIAFLEIMGREVKKDGNHNWVAILPFKSPRCRFPQNRTLAERRLTALIHNLAKKYDTQRRFSFMKRRFKNGHAEKSPPLKEEEECWYLLILGVYHPPPQKKRKFEWFFIPVSNIMEYPSTTCWSLDLTPTTHWSVSSVTIMTDIEQMFHCFLVEREHKNYLVLVMERPFTLRGVL